MSRDGGDATTGLDGLRETPSRRRVATLLGVLVGLAVAWVHWLGFVLGGALVALPQPSIRRGLAAGLGFGVLSLGAFAAWLGLAGAFGLYLDMGQLLAVSAAVPPVGALLGSLARGIR